jgi:2-polyprenyl-3-methyl-5-hydroxy-6-metoxy-1,4-benzoquinol methylase
MIDHSLLQQALLFSWRKQVFAWGELEMPYDLNLLDQQMELILSLLLALGQKPPPTVIKKWRHLIQVELANSSQLPSRWIFAYKPVSDLNGGLPAGFNLKFKLTDSFNSNAKLGIIAKGILKMPALPSFIETIIQQLAMILKALKQNLTQEELAFWKQEIEKKVFRWFQTSPNAYVVIDYEPLNAMLGLDGGFNLKVSTFIKSIDNLYHQWTTTTVRKDNLFGRYPDAKVMDIAQSLGIVPILDVGAGTGRNSLALAKANYPVDAVELTKVLSDHLFKTAIEENLLLNVIEGDIFASELLLPLAPYKLIILAEVIASHLRSWKQVRELMIRLGKLLQPGGIILFNTFLSVDGYEPSQQVRELGQFYWSYIMTRQELKSSLEGLPLKIIEDQSVHDYEKIHLPSDGWPPTSWFIHWSQGKNIFPLNIDPPVNLRWITVVRTEKID